MTKHIGIDPGLGGALAVIDEDCNVLALHDVPTLTLKASQKTRHEYDLPGMVRLLQPSQTFRITHPV